jgi:hypothetical protein
MEKEEVQKKFKLPDTKITVRLVDRQRGAISDKNHVLYNMAPGSTIEVCPRNEKGQKTIHCPLTKEEITFFENKALSGMSFNEGDLSPYHEDSVNYWRSNRAKVVLDDKSLELDLSNPSDYLKYKILLSNDDIIAPNSSSEFSKKSYIFVMESSQEQQKKVVKRGDLNKRAWKLASKLEDDIEGMIDFLTIVGKRPSKNSKKAFLVSEIDKYVEENKKDFLSILEDEHYPERVLLTKSLQIKAVLKDGHKYLLPDGTELCNRGEINNLPTALKFLSADENQDIRLMLEAKIMDK